MLFSHTSNVQPLDVQGGVLRVFVLIEEMSSHVLI